MKKLLLILVIPLLMGAGCTAITEKDNSDKVIQLEKKIIELEAEKEKTIDEEVSIMKEVVMDEPEPASVDLYAKYRHPQTEEIMSPEEYVEYWSVKCASQNKTRSITVNSDGTINCITYDQACQEKFGSNSIQFGNKDSEGFFSCGCENGYVLGADKKSCQKQQQGDYNGYDPYGVFDDGVAYSPEQRAQIECAYYGYNCQASAPTQIYDDYQDTPPSASTQTNTINCSNYQTEKAKLDQQAANSGSLFSGGRVSAENALKAKYPGCF